MLEKVSGCGCGWQRSGSEGATSSQAANKRKPGAQTKNEVKIREKIAATNHHNAYQHLNSAQSIAERLAHKPPPPTPLTPPPPPPPLRYIAIYIHAHIYIRTHTNTYKHTELYKSLRPPPSPPPPPPHTPPSRKIGKVSYQQRGLPQFDQRTPSFNQRVNSGPL